MEKSGHCMAIDKLKHNIWKNSSVIRFVFHLLVEHERHTKIHMAYNVIKRYDYDSTGGVRVR